MVYPHSVSAPADGSDGLAPRRAAVTLLHSVLRRRTPLDDAVSSMAAVSALSARDRAFCRLLVATVLRRLGHIDALIDGALQKPLPRGREAVRDLLRIGAAQLLFLNTPPHAAVSTAVTLAVHLRLTAFKGLINGILRRFDRERDSLGQRMGGPEAALPAWLRDRWHHAYGAPETTAIAAASLIDPPLDLTPHPDARVSAADLGATVLPTGTLRLPRTTRVETLPGFQDGQWWVQDAAAALPVRLLANALALRGAQVADLCAAPGGKTLQLAAAGARVTAVDRSAPRLDKLRQNLARTGLDATLVTADAATWQPETAFDAVLLDAPCSATGTLRRHPDIGWLKGPADVASLAAVQAALLAHAVTVLRPGGVLLWCTCSLQPEEGEHQIARLLAEAGPTGRRPTLSPDPIRSEELPGLEAAITAEGSVRTRPSLWPDLGGLDGFHISRLRRNL